MKKRKFSELLDSYKHDVKFASNDTLIKILQTMNCTEVTIGIVRQLQLNGEHWRCICANSDSESLLEHDLCVYDDELRARLRNI